MEQSRRPHRPDDWRDNWSLHMEFDSYQEQMERESMCHPLGDMASVEEYVLREFGGLPEELGEVLRSEGDGKLELTVDILDFAAKVMEWCVFHTIPRRLELVRNSIREGEQA